MLVSGSWRLVLAILVSVPLMANVVHAAALSVMPTRIEVPAGSGHATMTIRAGQGEEVAVQIRVFRWKEGQPADRLAETSDVAVSPPMARIGRGQELTMRIVRTSRRPARGRECYRVLVDSLPTQNQRPGQVALRLRHSVPLRFGD